MEKGRVSDGYMSSSDAESDVECNHEKRGGKTRGQAELLSHCSALARVQATSFIHSSNSEPHLCVPQFIHGQDYQHISSLTKVFLNIPVVDSALDKPITLFAKTLNIPIVEESESKTTEGSTDFELNAATNRRASRSTSDLSGLSAVPLRKTSSTTNCSITSAANLSIQPSADTIGADLISKEKGIVSIRDRLAMQNASVSSFQADKAVAEVQDKSVSDNKMSADNSVSLSIEPDSNKELNAEKTPTSSGILGIFCRGFFARPVLQTKEESYRYLFALENN